MPEYRITGHIGVDKRRNNPTPLDKATFRAKFFYYGSFRTIPFTHGILYNKRVITSPRLILFFWEGAICTHRVDYFINPFN